MDDIIKHITNWGGEEKVFASFLCVTEKGARGKYLEPFTYRKNMNFMIF